MEGHGTTVQVRGILAPAGLAFALFLAPSVVPLVGEFFALFTPTPLVLAGLRAGWRVAAIAGLIAMGAVTLLFGSSVALVFAVQYIVAAVAMTEALRHRVTATTAVAGSAAAMALAGAVVLGVMLVMTNQHPFDYITTAIDRTLEQALEASRSMGQPKEQLAAMRQVTEHVARGISLLLPGLLVSGALVGATANFLAVRRVLMRVGLAAQLHDADLGLWSAPRKSVIATLLAGVALLIPQQLLRTAAANVFLVLAFVFFLQGVAVAHFYLTRSTLSRLLRAAGYLLLVVAPVMVAAVGLFDSWFDFRRLSRGQTMHGS